MSRYIVRRLLLFIPLLLAVSVLTFALVHVAPGDPIATQFGFKLSGMSPERIQQIRQQLGLNDPVPVQYLRYLNNLLHGDMGMSLTTNTPVAREILTRVPATLELTVSGMLFVIIVAIPLGVVSALKRNSLIDNVAMGTALLGVSMPSFWLGIMLILLFSLKLNLLPSSGRGEGLWGTVQTLILPAITLGTGMMGLVTRVVRSSMLEVLGQDYMRTAHAKGLAPRIVILGHGLRNALIPVVTILGLQFAYLLGGAVIIETIFAWPGMGRLAVNAIWRRDYPVIMGTVLVFSVIFLTANLLVDVLYTLIDPRIRYE